jgi:trimeric autotransporter adhesin
MARTITAAAMMASLLFGGCGASLQSRFDTPPVKQPDPLESPPKPAAPRPAPGAELPKPAAPPSTFREEPLVGATYSLPMLAYDLKINRSLAACPAPVSLVVGDDVTPTVTSSVWSGEIDIKTEVQAAALSLPGERFRYDPGKLKAISKTTAFKMTYHPGGDRLAGINATLDDQTGAILGDVAKVGLAIASVALGPATGGASLLALPPTIQGLSGGEKAELRNMQETGFVSQRLGIGKSRAFLAELARAQAVATRVPPLEAALVASSDTVEMIVCTDAGRALLVRRQAEATNKGKAAAAAAVAARRAEALLAVARVRRLGTTARNRLQDAAVEAARQLDAADAAQAEIAELDAQLAVGSTMIWPKSPAEPVAVAGRFGPVAIEEGVDAARLKFGSLFVRRQVPLLNPFKFALALQADKALRDSIGAQATAFLDGNGEPRKTQERVKNDVTVAVARKCRSAPGGSQAEYIACAMALIGPLTAVLQAEAGASQRRDLPSPVDGSKPVPQWRERIHKGLLYRLPVAGHFTLCKAADATKDGCPGVTLLREAAQIPQLGALRVLPLKNGMFQNTGLVANFDASGNLTDVAFNTTKAIAANAATAAAAIAKDIKDFDDARRKQVKEAEAEAVAKAAAAKAEALAEAARAQAAATAVATAARTAADELTKDLTADANVAKARLTLAQAEAALLDYANQRDGEDE